MARKFLIAIAAIVAIMAALAIVPALSNPRQLLTIDYTREPLIRVEGGQYDIAERHTLTIADDGSAVYTKFDSRGERIDTRRFFVSGEEMRVLRELFVATGFMQIPATSYSERAGLANYTRYHLSVQSGEDSQSIRWVNPEAADGAVPSIVINAGTRLDEVIRKYAAS